MDVFIQDMNFKKNIYLKWHLFIYIDWSMVISSFQCICIMEYGRVVKFSRFQCICMFYLYQYRSKEKLPQFHMPLPSVLFLFFCIALFTFLMATGDYCSVIARMTSLSTNQIARITILLIRPAHTGNNMHVLVNSQNTVLSWSSRLDIQSYALTVNPNILME